MKMPSGSVTEHFRDGRNASNMMRHLAVDTFPSTCRLMNQQEEVDIIAIGDDGWAEKWMVVCLTKHGVSFAPSKMKGVGRKFNAEDWAHGLGRIKGFVVCDITEFPLVEIYHVSSEEVLKAYLNGLTSRKASMSLKCFRTY